MSRPNPFNKVQWINEQTKLSANNLNRIEQGIYDAYSQANEASDRLDTILEQDTQDTAKKATCDANGNVIDETYATKASDQAKLPKGDGTSTQTMFDALEIASARGLLANMFKSLSQDTIIDMKNSAIKLTIHPNTTTEMSYTFKDNGVVEKSYKTLDSTTLLYIPVSKQLYLDILEWIHTYVSQDNNNKILIQNSNLKDATISHTAKPLRNAWSTSDAPAALKDIHTERENIDQTFSTKYELSLLLESNKTDTAKKATSDEEGSNIKTTYATKVALAESNAEIDKRAIKNKLGLKYNSDTGVTALVYFTNEQKTEWEVLSYIDLPTELLINKGYYNPTTKEIVLVLSNYVEANPQPTASTFTPNTYYILNNSTYSLAETFVAGTQYFEHSTIKIPATGLIDVYTGQTTSTIEVVVDNQNKISASVRLGSISKEHLTQALQNDLNIILTNEYGGEGYTPSNPASGSRMANENARVEAETTRATNEATRNTSETQRNVNEYGGPGYTQANPAEGSRVYNENQRIANEQARQTAEAQRALDHTAWDTKVNTTYQNIVNGYWTSLLSLWNAKDSAIDSDLAAYKLAKDTAIAQSLASYEQTTTANLNTAVSNAIANYTSSIEAWRTVVNSTLGIGANPSLDATLDTLAEIINYIKEEPNSEYATLVAHVQAHDTRLNELVAYTSLMVRNDNDLNNQYEQACAEIETEVESENDNITITTPTVTTSGDDITFTSESTFAVGDNIYL